MRNRLIAIVLALVGLSAPAAAQSMYAPAPAQPTYATGSPFTDIELRGGIFAHSVDEGLLTLTRIEDLNVELLIGLPAIDEAVRVGRFRPHVGGTFNFNGNESMVYGGISWTIPVFDTPFFVEASLGGTVHNGDITGAVYPRRDLGCRILFRESFSIGYNITEQASVMLTAEHASHASMCSSVNQGLTNLGVRVGWRF